MDWHITGFTISWWLVSVATPQSTVGLAVGLSTLLLQRASRHLTVLNWQEIGDASLRCVTKQKRWWHDGTALF